MKSKDASIVFAAGASGGHIFPALAIAKKSENKKIFIGSGTAVEKKILEPRQDIEYFNISASAIRGKGILGILKFLFILPANLIKCVKCYKKNKVKCIIGFGGYPSVIPVLAGKLIGLPIFIHEQNAFPGMANKFLSIFARHTFCVPGAKGLRDPKTEIMNPVRESFEKVSEYRSNQQESTLLVMGGSQGAKSLNTAVIELVDLFKEKKIKVIHQSGKKDLERIKELYAQKNFNAEVLSFIDDLSSVFEEIDLIISRAGAMSISEISAAGRAAIYVPLNIAGGHQIENVNSLLEVDAARVVKQDTDLVQNLKNEINSLSKEEIEKMAMNARQFYFKHGRDSAKSVIDRINRSL